jgi:hypothetical protein
MKPALIREQLTKKWGDHRGTGRKTVTSVVLADAEIIFPEGTVSIVVNFLIRPVWKESRHKNERIM